MGRCVVVGHNGSAKTLLTTLPRLVQPTYKYLRGQCMSEEKDWNAWFAELKDDRDSERADKLSNAKAAAAGTKKEPFNAKKFREIYTKLDDYGVDENTPWETLLEESEYDYYVNNPDILSLEEFVKHLIWQDGFA